MARVITAVLKEWTLDADNRLHGQVYADKEKRFVDGFDIVTSKLSHIERDIYVGALAITKNSVYLLR